MKLRHLLFAAPLLASMPAKAEEGMWTFNRFPTDKVKQAYGFAPDQKWLDHVRLSSVRLAQGCSASFVSKDGLVMTNHHCVHECVEELSTPSKDYIADGFFAKAQADEVKCPDLEVNQLIDIKDVTARVMKAAEGLTDAAANDAKKAEMSRIEKECATSDSLRCDIVTLYNGGVYDLYTYKRHQDVRLVFAPELAIAFFGGDPDNFMFPRHDLDSAFVRVYENGKPAKVKDFFKWSKSGTKEGELTFTAGNPGSTSRLKTIAEILAFRDFGLVKRLMYLSEIRGELVQYAKRGAEQERHSKAMLFGVENGLKAFKGEADALFAPGFVDAIKQKEDALRAKVMADKELAAKYGGAWDAVAGAVQRSRALSVRLGQLEGGQGFRNELFSFARMLVRAADEFQKPNEKRLREFTEGRKPGLEAQLMSPAPLYPEFEIFRMTFALTKLREYLGPDDPTVKLVLGSESPEQLATRLVNGTKLGDPAVRKALYEGGAAAIAASDDPMLKLAKLIDAESRTLRKQYEDEVEAVVRKNNELIAAARFAIEGTSSYPDATFTPRVSYGTVKGWQEGEKAIKPYTTFGTTFERHTGAEPFALPLSWLDAKPELDLSTPMNLCTTNDIIGGNSGSPVFNRNAEIVGLIFDGNIHSLGGDYGFDPELNRAVAVDSRAIVHALDKVYGATRLVKELTGR